MWQDKFLKEANDDLNKLDQELREIVLAGIKKVRQNPLPQNGMKIIVTIQPPNEKRSMVITCLRIRLERNCKSDKG